MPAQGHTHLAHVLESVINNLLLLLQCQPVCIQDFLDQRSASLICFNLGYLPCADGKAETATKQDTTVAAVKAALQVVSSRGLVSILAYIGHPGDTLHAALCSTGSICACAERLFPHDCTLVGFAVTVPQKQPGCRQKRQQNKQRQALHAVAKVSSMFKSCQLHPANWRLV